MYRSSMYFYSSRKRNLGETLDMICPCFTLPPLASTVILFLLLRIADCGGVTRICDLLQAIIISVIRGWLEHQICTREGELWGQKGRRPHARIHILLKIKHLT